MSDVVVRPDQTIEVDDEQIHIDLTVVEEQTTIAVEETTTIVSVSGGDTIVIGVGIPGPAGAPGNDTYIHYQSSPEATWTITHNLGKYPSVTVVDSAGSIITGNVQYIDRNQIVVSFTAGFSGRAYLN